jgi:putative ABC transport system permease protein
LLNQDLAYGSFYSDDRTGYDKVVVGSQLAHALFSENVPLGQTVTILGHQFVVAGIFNDFQIAPLSIDTNFNNAAFIQYASAKDISNNSAPIYEILARSQHVSQTDAVVRSLDSSLLAAHGGQHDFTVLKQSQTIAVTDRILNLLTALTAGVAAIALLIGGVGIMNVMLVSVTERMHEVGIRKAVGATNRQILGQFITEATVLSVAGTVLGVLLSVAVVVLLRIFSPLSPVITWQVAIIACFVAIGVGVLFGSAPALKAARKDPIEALRNE